VNFGIIIRVRPILRTRETVENKVYVEVSVPVKKTSAGLELDIFSSEQTIVCKKGESIILTGLFQKLTTRLGNRTPLLGYIPLVDMFFSQRDKKGSQKELVALLTQSTILPRPSTVVPFSTSGARLSDSVPAR
jgi:type II secretory pathway component GspD/PulD (secretin)